MDRVALFEAVALRCLATWQPEPLITMIIDMHCHMGLSERRATPWPGRFSFEPHGSSGYEGYDAYMSQRILGSVLWRYIKRKLGIDRALVQGPELDAALLDTCERHLLEASDVDRFVLLAFDEYHDDSGRPIGPISSVQPVGSDMYTSNSFIKMLCMKHPDRYLFGASVHPYRPKAVEALEEVAQGGAVLVKWLPVHQNIDARDPRVERFVRRAGKLGLPLLIHYGTESFLRANHGSFESPVPMFDLLEKIRVDAPIPPVIIAHVAAPTLPFQKGEHYRATTSALVGRFPGDPVYADISALAHRPRCLKDLLRRRELHGKLVYGSDFPIPPTTMWFPLLLWGKRRKLLSHPSWAQQNYSIMKALGVPEEVFNRGYHILQEKRRKKGSEAFFVP